MSLPLLLKLDGQRGAATPLLASVDEGAYRCCHYGFDITAAWMKGSEDCIPDHSYIRTDRFESAVTWATGDCPDMDPPNLPFCTSSTHQACTRPPVTLPTREEYDKFFRHDDVPAIQYPLMSEVSESDYDEATDSYVVQVYFVARIAAELISVLSDARGNALDEARGSAIVPNSLEFELGGGGQFPSQWGVRNHWLSRKKPVIVLHEPALDPSIIWEVREVPNDPVPYHQGTVNATITMRLRRWFFQPSCQGYPFWGQAPDSYLLRIFFAPESDESINLPPFIMPSICRNLYAHSGQLEAMKFWGHLRCLRV